jgi:hypothetical protein
VPNEFRKIVSSPIRVRRQAVIGTNAVVFFLVSPSEKVRSSGRFLSCGRMFLIGRFTRASPRSEWAGTGKTFSASRVLWLKSDRGKRRQSSTLQRAMRAMARLSSVTVPAYLQPNAPNVRAEGVEETGESLLGRLAVSNRPADFAKRSWRSGVW